MSHNTIILRVRDVRGMTFPAMCGIGHLKAGRGASRSRLFYFQNSEATA